MYLKTSAGGHWGAKLKYAGYDILVVKGRAERPVYIFIHENLDFRLWEGKLDPHVLHNHEEIRGVLEKEGNVRAVFQGHCHAGRYSRMGGIDYITFQAAVDGDLEYVKKLIGVNKGNNGPSLEKDKVHTEVVELLRGNL